MKKKIGWILTLISIVIIVMYFIIINVTLERTPVISDINGNREALEDMTLVVTKDRDRYSSNTFAISKDTIEKNNTYYDNGIIYNSNIKEDKRFYRNNSSYQYSIYEGDISRLSARVYTSNENYSYINIRYRNKDTNEYKDFKLEIPNIDTIIGVYSKGTDNKIVVETNKEIWGSDIAIIKIDIESEDYSVEHKINMENDQRNLSFANVYSHNNMSFNSMIYDNKLYALMMNSVDGGAYGMISIDLDTGNIEEFSHEFKYSNIPSAYENVVYFTRINDSTQTIDIIAFDTLNESFTEYKDLKFDSEIGDQWSYGSTLNIRIEDDILYLHYYHSGLKNSRYFINVIDLKSKESLYLGELKNCTLAYFNK